MFESLDFVYTPSSDVAADRDHFVDVIGGRQVFAVEAMGVRVAAIELAEGSPLILLTDHLEGDRPVLVYRVADLNQALDAMQARGWQRQSSFGIPHGPCCSFTLEGGHRLALYQLTRPGAPAHFAGRADF